MIKNILTTMALLSLSLCTKAQDLPLVLSGHNEVGILPGKFTSDTSDQLYTYPLTEKKADSEKYAGVKHFNLYDVQLNPICSIVADDGIVPFSCFTDSKKHFLYVTQDLFDSDSKYEYISALSLEGNNYAAYLTGIKIQNEDGKYSQKFLSEINGNFLHFTIRKNKINRLEFFFSIIISRILAVLTYA